MNPDNNFTLKEMIQEVRDSQEFLKVQSTKTLEHSANVDKHLTQLNSKVATHENDIMKLKTFQTKALTIWSVALLIVTAVINKVI